ncbi:Rieske (2Fe-2S) protein [Cryptosporangium minutisporangium]|uniref:Nitrite reductase small subunit NirD n=1 Tax=Cryptosporangium minutisporangium TaxID=113569 RepID=A0ABP6TA41_9ACTN
MSAPTRQVLGTVDEIPLGEGRVYTVGEEQVAVFRLTDGSVRALGAVCPHAGGPLADGLIDGSVVVCPLHNNTFELTTGCSPTGQPSVPSYPVHVDADGQLVLG